MRFVRRALGVIVLLVVVLGLGFVVAEPERVWGLFGPPDLGAVTFETLQRRTTPNDALACSPDICKARNDLVPPVFAVSARVLRDAFSAVVAGEPRVVRVAADDATLTDRYIQRTPLMGFPDTIVVRFLDRPDGHATLALYSRSQLGEGDMGVNLARVRLWLDRLTAVVGKAA